MASLRPRLCWQKTSSGSCRWMHCAFVGVTTPPTRWWRWRSQLRLAVPWRQCDTVADAEVSAVALQVHLRELTTTGAPAEVAGEFDVRTDKPILRISRRHHGNVKSSVITQDFVHGADYAALAEAAATFKGLISEGAKVMRGEGERQKEEKVSDFREAMHLRSRRCTRSRPARKSNTSRTRQRSIAFCCASR